MNETVELELGIEPNDCHSEAVLVQLEGSAVLAFRADRVIESGDDCSWEPAGTAIFCFKNCLATRFGYPNDEPRYKIMRLDGVAEGIYEVHQSTWIQDTLRDNRLSFPDTEDEYAGRHLVFAFHDSTFECLTNDFEFELSEEPREKILETLAARVGLC